MKILMSCRQHPYHLCGGLAIASWNTARAAVAAGHEVHYITGAHPSKEFSDEDGVKVHWLKGMSHEADGYQFLYAYLRQNADKLAAEYDLFHSQSSALTPLLDQGRPIIFQDHGTQLAAMQDDHNQTAFGLQHTPFYKTNIPYHKLYAEFINHIDGKEIDYLRRFNRVLATSKISQMDLCTRYYLTNVRLFYHCIYDLPAPVVPNNRKPVVAFFAFGLDSPQKAVEYGMRQLLPIKDKIKVKVIGMGTVVPNFARANFPDVQVTGYLKEQDAIREFQEADVLFECSCHHRGTNLTAITALGLGIPVVAYPTSGHMDLIGEEALTQTYGRGGAIVDPIPVWHHPQRPPEKFSVKEKKPADVIMNVINNRAQFSASALQLFHERFSPEACSRELAKIYQEISEVKQG
jgi:glycosyltransferase involved in cell wall biosynthesis